MKRQLRDRSQPSSRVHTGGAAGPRPAVGDSTNQDPWSCPEKKFLQAASLNDVDHAEFILPLNLLFRLYSDTIRIRGGSVYLS